MIPNVPSVWSSICRCCAVTTVMGWTSGRAARRSSTGASFTTSGRVPKQSITRDGSVWLWVGNVTGRSVYERPMAAKSDCRADGRMS